MLPPRPLTMAVPALLLTLATLLCASAAPAREVLFAASPSESIDARSGAGLVSPWSGADPQANAVTAYLSKGPEPWTFPLPTESVESDACQQLMGSDLLAYINCINGDFTFHVFLSLQLLDLSEHEFFVFFDSRVDDLFHKFNIRLSAPDRNLSLVKLDETLNHEFLEEFFVRFFRRTGRRRIDDIYNLYSFFLLFLFLFRAGAARQHTPKLQNPQKTSRLRIFLR